MATLKSCRQPDEVWPELHACWPCQNAIDRFVSTLGKIHDSTHLS